MSSTPPPPLGLVVLEYEADAGTFALFEFPVPPNGAEPLTESECATLVAILRGRSNKAIARERGVALRTVANQVAGLFRKLGVTSRVELAALWLAKLAHPRD